MATKTLATTSSSEVDHFAHLDRLADEIALRVRSPKTIKAYRTDWADFAGWCAEHDVEPLPATVDTVRRYATDRAHTLALSTVRRRLAAISVVHKSAGHEEPPTSSASVREFMKGLSRVAAEQGHAQRQADALTVDKLRKIIDRIDITTNAGLRDRALILIGFAGFLRRSELAALQRSEVEETEEGLRITIRRSKTDQTAEGATVGIIAGTDPSTCPLAAMHAWLEIACAEKEDGPVFRRVRKNGLVGTEALSPGSIARVLKTRALAAGLKSTDIAGHSLRRGAATTAAQAGASAREIERSGRWSTGSRVVARYINDGSVFADSAARKLGL